MTPKTAACLVRLYPHEWRARYGVEFAALLEEHSLSFQTLVNILWSAAEAHMRAASSNKHDYGTVAEAIWSAWMVAAIAGLILYGTVDDSSLLARMNQSPTLAASWSVILLGFVVAVAAIIVGALPLASSIGLYALRKRRRDTGVRLAVPLITAAVMFLWTAALLISTRGHWAGSPWAVSIARPDWPVSTTRWITGSISAILLIFSCIASAASVSAVLRRSHPPDLRIAFPGGLRLEPLSIAAKLAPCAAAGILIMLAGVVMWGCIAIRLSAMAFHESGGPLGLTSLASWLLSVVLFGLAALISGQAAWRGRISPVYR